MFSPPFYGNQQYKLTYPKDKQKMHGNKKKAEPEV
jgi:hypothetical protein